MAPALLMALSGFAALGYQMAWTQQCALWLGHETAAVLAVVAGFFGGIGVGAWTLARRIDSSTRPVRWYVACEVSIAVWSAVLVACMAPASQLLMSFIGAEPTPAWNAFVVFSGTFLLLLPATAAMGATLPAMERMLSMRTQTAARLQSIAALYASNTAGAVAGVLVSALVLVPLIGLRMTATLCIGANLLCGALAWRIFARRDDAPRIPRPLAPASTGAAMRPATRTLALLAATGFLGIGFEVLMVRAVSQLTENTVYTFAILLAVYLVGTAIGAARYARQAHATDHAHVVRDRLLRAVAFACLAGILALACVAPIASRLHVGNGIIAALSLEAALAIAAFLPATIAMGALFSHLASSARAGGVRFGHALGANTLGAALAPPLLGCALPWAGSTGALLVVAACYLLLTTPRAWISTTQLAGAVAAAALAIWSPTLAWVDVPEGGRIVSRVEGTGATVSVVADAQGVATLRINNRQQEGSTATWFADARQGVLPLRLHAAPRNALFLGVGTGVTARAAAADATVRVDAAELLPEVVMATHYFTRADSADHPQPRIYLADARRFVRTTPNYYDVIVADNFHPARSGSGALYTVEHFEAVRARLAPDGVFCQWLPLHQLDLATLRSIVRSFTQVHPRSWALLATHSLDTPVLGLVARRDDGGFAAGDSRREGPVVAALGLAEDLAVYGSFIAGPEALAKFAGDAPLNTDDRPVVSYRAPRIAYAPDSAPRERLLELVHALRISPAELLPNARDAQWNRRLSAYWRARDRYLEIGSAVRRTPDVEQMLAQVREPLLAVLDISADFQPAYDPLLHMAEELAHRDASAARTLLARLARIQPTRKETIEALRALDAALPHGSAL
jgi:spermidine synthase